MIELAAKALPESVRDLVRDPYRRFSRRLMRRPEWLTAKQWMADARKSPLGRVARAGAEPLRREIFLQLFRRQLETTIRETDGPILLHTAGKDGSRGVRLHLLEEFPETDRRLYKTHVLDRPLEADEIRAVTSDAGWPPPHVYLSEVLRRALQSPQRHETDWSLLTTVREPVARNASAFFFSLPAFLPDLHRRLRDDDFEIDRLIDRFVDEFPHDHVLNWFDREVRDSPLGIDVYEHPSPREKGWTLVEEPPFSHGIVRLRDLEEALPALIDEMFDVEIPPPEHAHSTASTALGDLYREFKDAVTLPNELLDRIYASRYAEHFFTAEERDQFRERWSR